MGFLRHLHGRRRTSSRTICLISVVALLLLVASSSATPERHKISSSGGNAMPMPHHHRRRGGDFGHDLGRGRGHGWESSRVLWMRLVGPGSSPPTCRSKCGRCAPCRPVHVPIHPGRVSVPLEYYPEAWRCKCGDTLFMP